MWPRLVVGVGAEFETAGVSIAEGLLWQQRRLLVEGVVAVVVVRVEVFDVGVQRSCMRETRQKKRRIRKGNEGGVRKGGSALLHETAVPTLC